MSVSSFALRVTEHEFSTGRRAKVLMNPNLLALAGSIDFDALLGEGVVAGDVMETLAREVWVEPRIVSNIEDCDEECRERITVRHMDAVELLETLDLFKEAMASVERFRKERAGDDGDSSGEGVADAPKRPARPSRRKPAGVGR